MIYSREAGRLYCKSDDHWKSVFAIEGSTHEPCWYLTEESESWDICADTARGKLYCFVWPGVTVVDLPKRTVAANLPLGSMDDDPVSGCVNSPLGKTYVLTDRGGVLVIDAVADTVVASLKLDSTVNWNLTACASPARRILCTAGDTGLGVLIDCATDSVCGTVRLNSPVQVLETGPQGTTFVAATSGYLYVIEAGTGAILDSVKAGPKPSALCRVSLMHKVYLADMDERRLYVLSTLLDSVVGRVDLDGEPYGISYDSIDSKLYVACTQDDAIWVVDCASDKVLTRIKQVTSGRQSPLTYSAFGNRIYFAWGDSLGVIECCLDAVTQRFRSRWYGWGTPCVFPAMRLVTSTSEVEFITIFEDLPARPFVTAAAQRREPTVARGLLHITGARTGCLFDLSGRNVLDLLPGWNDVSGLPPGIYFTREQKADGGGPAKTRKVVILP